MADQICVDRAQDQQPCVKKLLRQRRSRSFELPSHQSSQKRVRPMTIIHTTIRSITDIPSKDNLSSVSTMNVQKSNVCRNKIGPSNTLRHCISVTKIHRQHCSSSKLSQDKSENNNSNKTSFNRTDSSIKQLINTPNWYVESPTLKSLNATDHEKTTPKTQIDQFGDTKDHHKNFDPKRKKKKLTHYFVASNVSLRWNSTGVTIAGIVGLTGSTSNRLYNPYGLEIDYNNTLYIADYDNNRVQKYFMGVSSVVTIAGQAGGRAGSNSSSLNRLANIIVDLNNNLYVTDIFNARVQLFPKGATSATAVAGISGSSGSATNQLNVPYGIAYDENSPTMYIADTGNHRIMQYLSGATSGIILAGNNVAGLSNTQFNQPTFVYFDSPSNSLVIANQFAHNIVRWVLGAKNWTLIVGSGSGSPGTKSTLLRFPVGVTLDPIGNVYVADTLNHRIQFFLAGQENGSTIAKALGVTGSNVTLLDTPYSVALDNQLNLYVADTYNHRVQKFFRY